MIAQVVGGRSEHASSEKKVGAVAQVFAPGKKPKPAGKRHASGATKASRVKGAKKKGNAKLIGGKKKK